MKKIFKGGRKKTVAPRMVHENRRKTKKKHYNTHKGERKKRGITTLGRGFNKKGTVVDKRREEQWKGKGGKSCSRKLTMVENKCTEVYPPCSLEMDVVIQRPTFASVGRADDVGVDTVIW